MYIEMEVGQCMAQQCMIGRSERGGGAKARDRQKGRDRMKDKEEGMVKW
jgi:hypothetical protein